MKTHRRQKYKRRREDILKLRQDGHSYKQIRKKLGCSISTISYHCGATQSEKKRKQEQHNNKDPLCKKVGSFKARCARGWRGFSNKVKGFKRRGKGRRPPRGYWRVKVSKPYTCADVVNKLGVHPLCYLTGRKIKLDDPSSYNLDHRIPASRGGSNDLNNLEISCTEANSAKADLTLKEFYALCEEILAWRDNPARKKKRGCGRKNPRDSNK